MNFKREITYLLFLCSSVVWGQDFASNINPTFSEIRNEFYKSFEKEKKERKSKHLVSKKMDPKLKQFKRWEYFWQGRLDENGRIPSRLPMTSNSLLHEINTSFKSSSATAQWKFLGPKENNAQTGIGRINRVVFNPKNPSEVWALTPSGGLFKSTNEGDEWTPMAQNLASIGVGGLAIDPNNTNIMYMGTGDPDGNDAFSIGVIKSTDGGVTWNSTGLTLPIPELKYVSKVLISPNNSNTIIASTGISSQSWASSGTGGIFKSTDAGATWSQKSPNGHFRHLEYQPNNFNTMLASTRDGKLYRSTDAGDTWTHITAGLPTQGDRIIIAFSPSDPNYAYVVVANGNTTGTYLSTDGGLTWTAKNTTKNLGDGQAWYDFAIIVDPQNKNRLFVGSQGIYTSEDAGATWFDISSSMASDEMHPDYHGFKFHPTKPNLLYVGHDGGVATLDIANLTKNSFQFEGVTYNVVEGTWKNKYKGLHATQLYLIGIKHKGGNQIIAGAQDNECFVSNNGTWTKATKGYDGMNGAVDQQDPKYMYASSQSGRILMSKNSFAQDGVEITPSNKKGGPWVTPYVLDPKNGNTMIAGYNNLLKYTSMRSLTGKVNWTDITPAGLDQASYEFSCIKYSAGNSNVVCAVAFDMNAGSKTYYSNDGGTSWKDITPKSISNTFSHYLKAITVNPTNDNHLWAVFAGYTAGSKVFRSVDAGATWTNVSSNLPNAPMRCIEYETGTKDRVFVGTDVGMYMKDENTDQWVKYGKDLPNVIVNDIEIQYDDKEVIAGTYGRGIWSVPLPKPITTIIESPQQLHVKVFPNPVTGEVLNIQLSDAYQANKIVVFNAVGTVYKIVNNPKGALVQINTNDFPAGSYFVSILDEKGKRSSVSFIVAK